MGSSQRQPDAPPSSLRARAAAKVNLGLYVGPLQPGGRYHEVVSVLQSIAIWDELEVEVVPEGLGLEVEGGGLPPTRPTWSWSRPASWPGAPATCPGPASGSARASRSRPASAGAAPTGPPP